MASSTDLPVNSWYSLMGLSVASLVGRSAFGWAGSSTGREVPVDGFRAIRRAGLTGVSGLGLRHLHGEARRVVARELRIPAEQGEHAAPAQDQVLLDDLDDGRRDPVEEQARGQHAAVQDRDQRQEVGHLPLDLLLGSSFFGSAAGSVIRDATSWNSDEMIARMLIPKPGCRSAVVTGSGRPQLIPKTTGLRQALMTCPAASKIGRGRGDTERRDQVDPNDVPHRARVVVRQALADDRVHRDQEPELQHDRQAAAGRVDAALAVELLDRGLLLDAIALVLALELLDLRLEQLHLPGGGQLAAVRAGSRGPA